MSDELNLHAIVPDSMAGKRLDQALSMLFSDYSRSRLKEWIMQGRVSVDGESLMPKTRLLGGESIEVQAVAVACPSEVIAEPVALDIHYEDSDILVINKPAGLVMHPAAGNWTGTVQNGLLHLNPELSHVPRAGIVHRLDKDTTGLFVVAKNLKAHKSLVEQLQMRHVARQYFALVNGTPVSGGTVDKPIGRHPVDRKRMAVRDKGKAAVTHYRISEKYRVHTMLSVQLETGRTHQIRVHMATMGLPLMGDILYGGRAKYPAACSESLRLAIGGFKRQALHAYQLTLEHPSSGETMQWQADIPADMKRMSELLKDDANVHEH